MSYWHNTGPKYSPATASISMEPKNRKQATVDIVFCEPPQHSDAGSDRFQYWLAVPAGHHLLPFCKGITEGLQGIASHRVADVRVRILNAVIDNIDSTARTFEVLGQRLTEALDIEMHRRGVILASA